MPCLWRSNIERVARVRYNVVVYKIKKKKKQIRNPVYMSACVRHVRRVRGPLFGYAMPDI